MNDAAASQPDRLLRLCDVIEMTGIRKTMIYRLIAEGRFPKQFKPGGYSSRWSEAEVRAWIEAQRSAA
jgi:prophage regulatory protein